MTGHPIFYLLNKSNLYADCKICNLYNLIINKLCKRKETFISECEFLRHRSVQNSTLFYKYALNICVTYIIHVILIGVWLLASINSDTFVGLMCSVFFQERDFETLSHKKWKCPLQKCSGGTLSPPCVNVMTYEHNLNGACKSDCIQVCKWLISVSLTFTEIVMASD